MPGKGMQLWNVFWMVVAIAAVVGIVLLVWGLWPTRSNFRSQEVLTSRRRKFERRGFGPYGGFPGYGVRAL